jgi:hypothetical protein
MFNRKRLSVATACVGLMIVVGGCAQGSNGQTIGGRAGSPLWFATTTATDRNAYFGSMSVPKLCSEWRSAYERPSQERIRVAVGEELQKRGLSDQHCADGAEDARRDASKAQAEARRATQAARRAREEADAARRCIDVPRGPGGGRIC